jgi:hypothetical protein
MPRPVLPLWIGLLTAVLALPAAAQSAPKTGSLGGGAGAGPMMTRDELRACLKAQTALKQRVADYDSQRAALDQEKAAILAENQTLGNERAVVQTAGGSAQEANARAADLIKRVDDWKLRWQEFEAANRSGPTADRQRRRLTDEQRALQKEQAEINAIGGESGEAAVAAAKQFNAKAEALAARTVAYNERNKKVAKAGEDLVQERDLWASECGNRRYREDDETAIQQGK